ncbi:transposase [Sporomusa termitida]|uniref:Transposase IS200 like protein n=1 Tax=Sporomusa termitida TaxID=2377 RepID=A0A517DXB6_9FIRM|nr:transposase [Sporomusa termitida]QDR82005.1 Transposase IS200 like protein [Sporomusa termitida]
MSRKQRVHYHGAIYHITARGNNRQIIFRDEFDKTYYLTLLKHYKEKFACKLYAYVLMDNHVHLLLTVTSQPLAKVMQGVQLCYTQYYNKKYAHVGHVFQQRYNAELCADESYLLLALRYIHNNPLKAQIVDGLDYSWSSHQYYLRADCSFIDSSFILGIFSEGKTTAIARYLSFMKEEETPVPATRPQATIPEKTVAPGVAAADHPELLAELLQTVALENGIEVEDILGKSKNRQVVLARRQFICLALKSCQVSGAELARRFNVSQSQITRCLKPF